MKDYSLAGALMLSPAWTQFVSETTPTLAWMGVALGVVLAAIRVWREIRPQRKD